MIAEDIEPHTQRKKSTHEKWQVLLIDDHVLVRQGLALLLAEEPDIEVIGEASDGREGIEQVRKLHPDVVVLDFSMPHLDGAQVARILRAEFPKLRIVALSMYSREDREAAMLDAGANVYVEKNGSAEALLAAVRGGGQRRRRRA